MAKFHLYLPVVLLFLSCTHTPPPKPSVGPPRTVSRAMPVDQEVERPATTTKPIQAEQAEISSGPANKVEEPEPAESELKKPKELVEPELQKEEPEEIGGAPEVDGTGAEKSVVPESKETDSEPDEPVVAASKTPDAVDQEKVIAQDVGQDVETNQTSKPTDETAPVVEAEKAPDEVSVPVVEDKPATKDVPRPIVKEKKLRSIDLAVISTTKQPVYFFVGDQLISSIRPAEYKGASFRLVGSRELDLWRSPNGVEATASSVLESAGTVRLPEDVSSCLVFCAYYNGDYQFVVLPEGKGHLDSNGLCFVNLTSTALNVGMADESFRVPSREHYDLKLTDTFLGMLPTRIQIMGEAQGASSEFSGVVHGKGGHQKIFLLAKDIVVRNGRLQVQSIGEFNRDGLFITPDPPVDPVAPKPGEVNPSKTQDEYEPIQPAIQPGIRTI